MLAHAKLVKATKDIQIRAAREGSARYWRCIENGWQEYGWGDIRNHCSGRLAEICFTILSGAEDDPDFSWEADKRRGCDVIVNGVKWGVRSSRSQDGTMMIKPGDNDGPYAFAMTWDTPNVWFPGWMTAQEAKNRYPLTGMRKDPTRMIHEVPVKDLHPFTEVHA